MNYIGLDLSTKTGFVVLDEDGRVLEAREITSGKKDIARMIDLSQLIFRAVYSHEPCKVAIEGFSYGSKGSGVDFQYGLGWIIRKGLFETEIPFLIVPPTVLKKYAGAKGNAKKDALAVEIFKRWGYEHKSDNVRDAYVLAQMARGSVYTNDRPKFQQEALQKVTEGR